MQYSFKKGADYVFSIIFALIQAIIFLDLDELSKNLKIEKTQLVNHR